MLLPVITLMPVSLATAQEHGNKEYRERRKENAKKRAEYYRERDKKMDEHYRELDKKYAGYHREENKRMKEYYKEQAKQYKEYRKDRRDWDDDDLPHWAEAQHYYADHHVYFQDYYTFYDPYRRGYVYLHDDDWRFSRELPSFLAAVDLGRARIRIMADVPLSKPPEYYYHNYSRKYPRNPKIQVRVNVY